MIRKLHTKKHRTIREGIKKYPAFRFGSYTDESHILVPFTGATDSSQEDYCKLTQAIAKGFPSRHGLYGTSYGVARVFRFKNSGVVVLSTSMYIGD